MLNEEKNKIKPKKMEACGRNGSGSAAEFVAREAEVRRERGAQHAALWQNLTRFPSVASGWLHPAAPSASSTEIEATIFTKQRDLVGRKNRLVGRSYQCGSGGGGVRAVGGFGWEVKDVQLSSPSPSRGLLALVTNHTPEPPSPQQAKPALEIWEGSSLVQHIPLQDCHGAVYADETFGSLVWSRDETRVAYLAEPKREEKDFPSFWDVTPKADNGDAKDDKEKEKEKERGKWHEFNEDWGETFPGKTNPRPHVVDLATGKVRALRVPAHISFGQLRWLPDGRRLLAVGWETTERRLGIVYCTNRRSAVYLIGVDGDDDGKLTRVSADGGEDVTTPWSVPTPDGKGAVYASSPSLAPHNACFALRYVDLSAEATGSAPRTVVPIVDIPSADAVPPAFPGLYDTCGSDDYWLDDRTLVTPSLWGSRQVLLAINVDTGAIHDLSTGKLSGAKGGGEVEGERVSWDLCDVRKGAAILAIVSSPSLPPTPCFGALDTTSSGPRFVWSLFPATTSPRLDDMQQQFATIEHAIHSVPVSQGEYERFEVVAIHQSGGEDVAKRRVLVLPHGGPHSTFPSGFQPLYLFFALQGYVVLLVNYRGSLGYGEKPLESLMGRCGSQDVADVMQAVDYVTGTLKKGDPTKLYVCGGSHGGFLTCHVVGQHPDRFTAAVARNPVVNIASMLSISDIPDWCLVEALGADAWEAKKEVIDKADLVRLWEASPIAHVTHVKTPTMVQISFDDRRVPPSQGREFYYALKRLGVPTRLLTYESNAHAIVKVESEGDAWINAALWFDTAASAN